MHQLGAAFPGAPVVGPPAYLRVVVTTRCPLACSYCHLEGDPASGRHPVSDAELAAMLRVALRAGIRKVKFLGGEPLVHRGLPGIIEAAHAADPRADLSIITSGVAATARLDALFDAGLTRANLSIHGWSQEAFGRRRGTAAGHRLRQANLDRLLELGRPLKLNVVWGSEQDTDDLADLLDWAAGRPLVVNVLDDLQRDLGPEPLYAMLVRLRGTPRVSLAPDPDSLDTVHLRWPDGLVVELKHQQLGALAPWRACGACPRRPVCREGIHAVRLTHEGALRTCMDRPDIALPLLRVLREGGEGAALAAWRSWIADLLPARPATVAA